MIVMHIANILLSCILGVALSSAASAEIYQSQDAQGNTVFSDMPSQGAEKVKVPPTNAAEPVAITPRPEPSPDAAETRAKPRKSSAKPAGAEDEKRDNEYLDYGDNYYDHDEIDDRTRREKRRDEGDSAKPIGDRPAVTPHRNVAHPAGGGRR